MERVAWVQVFGRAAVVMDKSRGVLLAGEGGGSIGWVYDMGLHTARSVHGYRRGEGSWSTMLRQVGGSGMSVDHH